VTEPTAAPAATDPSGTVDPLRRLVAVMDRLRSPGGCPWDAEQTHASLVPYAIEEAHEVAEAVENDDRDNLREELGDLLLQVVFHARIAQEHPTEPFGVDEIADGLVAKLVRRHPHVFADAEVADADGVHRQWEQIKKTEKQRESALDGVPRGLGALARTQKIASRAGRAGLLDASAGAPATDADAIGDRLLALVLEAEAAGVDAEGALRRTARTWEDRLRARERT
jgi:XTP/dITP diphosphohydrolase